MYISENNPGNKFKLSKSEIIRGYDSYIKVLQDSTLLTTDYLKAFVNKQNEEFRSFDFKNSPLLTTNVKVGFIIAKKKIKKSFRRNRLKRLLKESYRLNKYQYGINNLKLMIIFSLSEKGYEYFKKNPDIKYSFVESEMRILQEKIKNKFTG